jgi:hypothetical protein
VKAKKLGSVPFVAEKQVQINNMLNRIRQSFLGTVYYNLKYGIKGLYNWIPVIWNDRQYDDYFLFKILRHKLILMEREYRRINVYVGQEKDHKKIQLCVYILNRIINDDYFFNAFMFHDKKWGSPTLECENIGNGKNRVHIKHKNVITEEDKKKQKFEFSKCVEHENYLIKQDRDYLFNILNKHSDKWWI